MKKWIVLLFSLTLHLVNAQNTNLKKVATIGFYNVENLFDTIQSADYIDGTLSKHNPAFHRSIPIDSIKFLEHTEHKGKWNDEALVGKKVVRKQGLSEEFTPSSSKRYNTKVYNQKLSNAAKVISELGYKYAKTAPAVVGLLEIENRQVIEDLINQESLRKYDYGIVHYNSYDYRGVDVALIYQKKRFTPTSSINRELVLFNDEGKREYTRDILIVSGLLDGEKFSFFVSHWPSRRGGEKKSAPKRNAAAALLKKEMDSIKSLDPEVKLVAMGDFNDDPTSPSLKKHLSCVGSEKELSNENPYLNLMYPLHKKGVASLAYRDAPNLFDQIVVSKNMVQGDSKSEYQIFKTEVYAPDYLINPEGAFKGYPFRSWNGDTFTGGYSDHFPVFTIVHKDFK